LLPCHNATQAAYVPAKGKLCGVAQAANERCNVVKAQKQWAQSNADDIGRAKVDNETIANELLCEFFRPVMQKRNVPATSTAVAGRAQREST
jgi:hypothetical protein